MAAIAHALMMSFTMAWEILWALILGFTLSAVVQAVVSKEEMSRLLPDDRPGTIVKACGLGAASSSCSYAAVALARSMFRKGANFTAAMAFQFASTNLVLELGILLAVLMGWQFTLAEFTGGPLMIVILVLLFKVFLTPKIVEAAREQANKGLQGRMEGHAGMDMSLHEGTIWQRMTSSKGRTAISHFFVMDWASLWLDIGGGLLIAGALAAWVPQLFLAGVLSARASNPCEALGACRWTDRSDSFFRLFCRKRPIGSRALEWWNQFWRGRRVSLRGPHRATDPRYLPQILWAEDQCFSSRSLLRFHVPRGACSRVHLRSVTPDSTTAACPDTCRVDPLELYNRSQHHLSRTRSRAGDPFSSHRRSRHAEDDEYNRSE